ncbi:Hsp33 family molecular chaperone HslO [Pasteurellaceae bacterium 20609_3]|uniref:Hsp33 family molecular chaperone HslO n=1 Tax=Spirabiliibacterium mucosae TaxID=28156 RepID=UPI001AACFF4F|nr:Hsp33 family molecular chaperone HslO [Spirabiliibacterium mucosae]MBE2898761.1 Hsp33 family molecular chaperone HslO [Spirabiliibacterium mucosae]
MTTAKHDNDSLYRFLFQNRAVRGEWVRLNRTFTDTLNTHDYPTAVRNLLGEMMVATALLTATLKFEGEITVQIRGDGPLKLALINGDDQLQLRALARCDGEIADDASLHAMVGNAVLLIAINPRQGERYQGIVELGKPSVSECLQDYFERSEQLKTALCIKTGVYDGESVAAGMLLQVMPDGIGEQDDLQHLQVLMETAKAEELFGLSAEEMLYRLYHEEEVELFPKSAVRFHCGCSQERSGGALMLLSDDEIDDILAEHNGSIDMRCECCGTHYYFNKDTIAQMKQQH